MRLIGRLGPALFTAIAILSASWAGSEAGEPLRLATTTTVEDSGLLDHLLGRYRAETGETVLAIVRGTGEAHSLARRGDVDIVLTHDRKGEDSLVATGDGLRRAAIMYNDFVIAGPNDDPARIKGRSPVEALKRIAENQAPFISRGDDSGTHRQEQRLWGEAGIDPVQGSGRWYLETGSGMGTTLLLAAGRGAYLLVDRGTWLANTRRGDLILLVEAAAPMRNEYGLVPVNPARHEKINSEAANRFFDWLSGDRGQRAIGEFRVGGQLLFHPIGTGQK